jgi:hypothetical protein
MSDALQQLLSMVPSAEATLYPSGTRYHGVGTTDMMMPDGRVVRFLRRRFLPDPSRLVTIAEHRVKDTDRADLLANQYLGDPLHSWRIADANGNLRLEALVEEVGRRLRITLPDGVEGPPDA